MTCRLSAGPRECWVFTLSPLHPLTPSLPMEIPHLHDWPTSEAEAVALQHALAGRVDTSAPPGRVRFVAGCDVAYHLTEPRLFAAVVVLDADLSVVEERVSVRETTFPYIPGLLSFRELPALLAA